MKLDRDLPRRAGNDGNHQLHRESLSRARSQELKLPVIKLLASKALTKKGVKRGTTYFAGKKK